MWEAEKENSSPKNGLLLMGIGKAMTQEPLFAKSCVDVP